MSVHQRLTAAQLDEFVATLLEFKRTNPAEYGLVEQAMRFTLDARKAKGHRASRARDLTRRLRASFGRGDTADVVDLLRCAR